MKPTLQEVNLGLICAMTGLLFGHSILKADEAVISNQQRAIRIESAREEVATLRSNIFLSLVALDRVRGERELQGPRFQEFTNQLGRMEALARAMGKRTEEMKQRGEAYFLDWEASTAAIQDSQARQQARQSYAERKKSYDAIGRLMQQAKASFFPFVEELMSIKSLLEGQRNEKSIATARDLFMRANWHSIDVQRALMETEDELDTLAGTFAKER